MPFLPFKGSKLCMSSLLFSVNIVNYNEQTTKTKKLLVCIFGSDYFAAVCTVTVWMWASWGGLLDCSCASATWTTWLLLLYPGCNLLCEKIQSGISKGKSCKGQSPEERGLSSSSSSGAAQNTGPPKQVVICLWERLQGASQPGKLLSGRCQNSRLLKESRYSAKPALFPQIAKTFSAT